MANPYVMLYNIYAGNKLIILTDDLQKTQGAIFALDNIHLEDITEKIYDNSIGNISLFHPNIEEAWIIFKKHFNVIEAAGGVVENDASQYLFIYRNGKWDLPKGKMEEGETPYITAIREVQEECGIQYITIDHFLFDTYHLFTENNKKRLKITHWYKMNETKKSDLTPQIEEGIEKVEWIDLNKHPEVLNSSYENIQMLFADARKLENIMPEN